jgi:hypothetical protein
MTTPEQSTPAGRPTAPWKAWMEVFADLAEDLSRLPDTPCPNCGAQTLGVAFYGPPGLGSATGLLWCGTCLQGVSASRMTVPEGAEVIPLGTPPEQWPVAMPDFEIVRPAEDDF